MSRSRGVQSEKTPPIKYDYRWVVLAVATVAQAAASFVMQGLGILAGFLQQDFGLSTLQVGLLMFLLVAAWLGFFGLGWYGPWVAFIADVSPRESRGLALGTAMAVNQVAIVAAPPLLGLLHDATGGYVAVWSCLVALLLAAAWGARRK